jgi:plastocyanin
MRLALPLTLLALAAPAPAFAANADVNVGDDFYDAPTVQIQPGDSVTWHWAGLDQHTVTASANQTMSFRSKLMSSGTFARTFAKPGRFTYFCETHSNMRGAVEVGPAPFPDTGLPRVSGAKAKVSRRTAKVSLRLSEKARVRVALSGPSKQVIARVLAQGKRSFSFRHLRAGSYRASLRATDTAGNNGRTVKLKRFRVR